MERTNCIGFIFLFLRCESVLPLIFSLGEEAVQCNTGQYEVINFIDTSKFAHG